MSVLENTLLKDEISTFSLYIRYMDDTLVICDEMRNPSDILQLFNSCHPAIKFTCEQEHEGKLAFLDILLEDS